MFLKRLSVFHVAWAAFGKEGMEAVILAEGSKMSRLGPRSSYGYHESSFWQKVAAFSSTCVVNAAILGAGSPFLGYKDCCSEKESSPAVICVLNTDKHSSTCRGTCRLEFPRTSTCFTMLNQAQVRVPAHWNLGPKPRRYVTPEMFPTSLSLSYA